MSISGTLADLDTFQRIRDTLRSVLTSEAPPTADKVSWYLPGFATACRVSTVFGDLPVEALRVRDDLRTFSGASARVQHIDRIHLDAEFLRSQQSALPIRIPANAFGPGRPSQDMLVSPGQEISSDAHVASHFVKARDLRDRFAADLTQSSGLTYHRFHCGAPAIVRIDGLWVRVQP